MLKLILLVTLLAQACAPAASPGGGTAPAQPTGGAEAWQKEWDETLVKAQQEGEVLVVTGGSASRTLRDAFRRFESKFGVKVTASGGGGRESADRLLAERTGGVYTADLWMTGISTTNTRIIPAGALDPINPILFHPEVLDQSKWFRGQHWYGDPEKKYVFLFGGGPSPDIAVNTSMFKPDEFGSYYDLFKPQYKGKILAMDPSLSGVGNSTAEYYLHPELGPNWIRRLINETDLGISRDFRQGAEWVAQGKYGVMVFMGSASTELTRLKEQGLPVDFVTRPMKEGSSIGVGGSGNISVVNRAPHPSAAKLFINWWLTREGQMAMEESSKERPSLREDISHEPIIPYERRQPGVNYTFPDAEPEFQQRIGEALKFTDDVMKAAGKKG